MKNESIRAWNNDLHAAVVIEGSTKAEKVARPRQILMAT